MMKISFLESKEEEARNVLSISYNKKNGLEMDLVKITPLGSFVRTPDQIANIYLSSFYFNWEHKLAKKLTESELMKLEADISTLKGKAPVYLKV